ATVTGWLRDLSVEASASGDDILLGPVSAKHVEAEVRGFGIGAGTPGFHVLAHADSAEAFSHPLQTARLEIGGSPDSMDVSVGAWHAGEDRLLGRGGMRRVVHESDSSVSV